jgi:hypothetical protein
MKKTIAMFSLFVVVAAIFAIGGIAQRSTDNVVTSKVYNLPPIPKQFGCMDRNNLSSDIIVSCEKELKKVSGFDQEAYINSCNAAQAYVKMYVRKDLRVNFDPKHGSCTVEERQVSFSTSIVCANETYLKNGYNSDGSQRRGTKEVCEKKHTKNTNWISVNFANPFN